MSTAEQTRTVDDRIADMARTGLPAFNDAAVVREIVTRYVAEAHRKLRRAETRDVEHLAELARRRAAREIQIHADRAERLQADCYAEWTAELLDESFALGDGTTVTYANATVAEHAQRMDMLEGFARGNRRTAAIHRRAIDAILDAPGVVTTLGEVVRNGRTS